MNFFEQNFRKIEMALVILATSLLILGGIFWGYVFIKPDEPLYIQIPLNMSGGRDILIPLNEGKPDFVKPPLVYWLELAAFEIFGKKVWGARLPIWLMGVLTAGLTYGIGKKLFNSEEAALTAAGLLLFNFSFFLYSQAVMMDIPLTFFAMLCTYTFILAATSSPLWLLPCGGSIGLITLVKGPVGVVLCAIPIMFYAWKYNALSLFRKKEMLASALIAIILGLAYPVLLLEKNYGRAWFDQFILGENFGKFGGERMPLKILLIGLFGGIAPWSFLLIESLWKNLIEISRQNCTSRNAKIFLFGSIISVFLVFSLPARKLPHYVIPAFPACALLIAGTANFSLFSIWMTRLLLSITGALWLIGLRLTPLLSVRLLIVIGSASLFLSAFLLKGRKNFKSAAFFFGVLLATLPVVMPAVQFGGEQSAVTKLSGEKIVGVFSPDDKDPRGFELSPGFVTCSTLPQARKFLENGGTLIFAEHNQKLLDPFPIQTKTSWDVWKTGVGLGQVIHAVISGDTSPLSEKMEAAVLRR